jgi:molybdopterin converting factor small subunit
MEAETATVGGILVDLCQRLGRDFEELVIDPISGEMSPHLRILLNGRCFVSVPKQLDISLKDGDELGLFPPLAGG